MDGAHLLDDLEPGQAVEVRYCDGVVGTWEGLFFDLRPHGRHWFLVLQVRHPHNARAVFVGVRTDFVKSIKRTVLTENK